MVEVVSLGRVSATALAVTAANIQAVLGLNTLVAAARPEPGHALIPTRNQYDAVIILKDLNQGQGGPPFRIGVTNHDLCLSFLTHVYGEAQMGGGAAVVSLHRLGQGEDGGRAPRALVLERLAKVALHETAHMLGLAHCRRPGCLMCFSSGLGELDGIGMEFCAQCQGRVEEMLRNMARERGRSRD